MDYPVFSTEQVDIGMVLQAGLLWEGDISVEEASKIQKCGQFLRGFKTLWKLIALYIQ